jgi:hypothetical protein
LSGRAAEQDSEDQFSQVAILLDLWISLRNAYKSSHNWEYALNAAAGIRTYSALHGIRRD